MPNVTVTLHLPDALGERVRDEAARSERPVEEVLVRLVEDAFAPDEAEAKRRRALALLDELDAVGDEAEQRETFAYLQEAVNADRLSERRRF